MTPAPIAEALAERYRIERELGAGGMATVYLADDLKHDRKVALKVLKPELAAVLGGDRFVQEIKTTANLQHPHILPLFDSGTANGFLYYVMPFIDGETLRDKLNREKQLGVEESVRIATEVADALDYAHRQGVIHRDIKPENILLHDGRPMVADFGIALALSAAAGGRMTETGMSIGTPYYMSPEQATAEKELSPRSDVYSLGCVLYEMLAGEPPHTGATAQAIILKIVADTARPVTDLRKSVPPNVAAALTKALEKLPADRFESAKAFAESLSNPAFGLVGPSATRAMVGGRVLPARGVSVRLFAAVGAVAVLAIVATLFLALRSRPEVRVSKFSVLLPILTYEEFQGTDNRFVATPDGRALVFLGDDGRLWVRSLDALEARALEGTNNANAAFMSPDGRQVGYLAQGQNAIRLVSLTGGPTITVADSGIGQWGATWSQDGFIYASSTAPTVTGIVRVPANGGGHAEPVTTIDRAAGETAHILPQALPNGKAILFTVQRGGVTSTNDIAVTVPGSGEHTILVRGVAARYTASGHLLYLTTNGTLMAVPFDQRRLRVDGDPVPILEGLPVAGAFADMDLTVSESGTLWYGTGSIAQDVEPIWVDRDGGVVPVEPGWVGDFRYPALSPDGTRLAYSIADNSEVQLWIRRLGPTGGTQAIFTREGSVNFRPSWSPDGRTIAFVSDRGPDYDMFVKPADQSGQAELLLGRDSDKPLWEVVYTGGPWLLYRAEDRASDLYAIRPGIDSTPTPLVVTDATERMPMLSPDGRWLVYTSTASGRTEVYVRPFPNVTETVWQVSTTGGNEPRWSHSGRELFYRSGDNHLVAVAIAAGATFEWGAPRALFPMTGYRTAGNGRMYDVTPDDRRFLMLRVLPSEKASEVIVVQNFFEELKAKVPR